MIRFRKNRLKYLFIYPVYKNKDIFFVNILTKNVVCVNIAIGNGKICIKRRICQVT